MTSYHRRRRPVLGCLLVALVGVIAVAVQLVFWVWLIKWAVSL